jgi:hypothetical protein
MTVSDPKAIKEYNDTYLLPFNNDAAIWLVEIAYPADISRE